MDLLFTSHCLLYTPPNEHFGIVPLEGMHCGLAVVALNSGGPLETVTEDGAVGDLVDDDVGAFADAMGAVAEAGEAAAGERGRRGKARVEANFSFRAFAAKLDHYVRTTAASQ